MALTPQEQKQLSEINQELQGRAQAKQQAQQQEVLGVIQGIVKSSKIIKPVEQRIDEDIAKRGKIQTQENIERVKGKGFGSKVLGVLGLAAEPFVRGESAIANVGLAAQRGVINPRFLAQEAKAGLTGVKQGQFGDIAKAGLASTGQEGALANATAATVGFVATMLSPIAAVSRVVKTFGKLSKFTDKGIRIAGKNLVSASDDAVEILGKELNQVYAPLNTMKGKTDDALFDAVSKLPKTVIDDIVEQTGKSIEDIVLEPTIGNLREVKRIVGEFRPSAFGKEAVGADVLKEGKNINKAYGTLKNSIQDVLAQNKMGKEGKRLLAADDAFSEIMSASKFVKKQVVDKTLRKATKAGSTATGIQKAGDLTTRESLNILKSAGGSARRNIVSAVQHLERYNNIVKAGTALRRGAQVAQNAAVIGLLLKTPVGKTILRGDD